jgi:hypothetical protein
MLFVVLLALSFFKDNLTPDYLNTGAAAFLSPNNQSSRLTTLGTNPLFWIISFIYSTCFTLLPYLIIDYYFDNKRLSRFVLFVHLTLFVVIYILVFMNNNIFDKAFVPKLNRYYHSPIMVLFFIAAFTLSQRKHVKQ